MSFKVERNSRRKLTNDDVVLKPMVGADMSRVMSDLADKFGVHYVPVYLFERNWWWKDCKTGLRTKLKDNKRFSGS